MQSISNVKQYEIHTFTDYINHKNNDTTHTKALINKCNCLDYEKDNNGNFIYKNKDHDITFKRCNNDAKHNGFCDKHQDCFDFMKLFTNANEPEYKPEIWNKDVFVKGSHNCYAYFLDVPNNALIIQCKKSCKNDSNCVKNTSTCQNMIPQPGRIRKALLYGTNNDIPNNYTCPNMINKIKADNPGIKQVNFTNKCEKGTYKGAMVVDTNKTFHFYRLNQDGSWSHKPGITNVKDTDASGHKIAVPHFADRNYKRNSNNSNINYDGFCGYFCIPKGEKLAA